MTLFPRGLEHTESNLKGLDSKIITSMNPLKNLVRTIAETPQLSPTQIRAIAKGLESVDNNRSPAAQAD